jgi:hypothetical protein
MDDLDIPIAGWFISWKILFKWMMTGGTPISGNPHIWDNTGILIYGTIREFKQEFRATERGRPNAAKDGKYMQVLGTPPSL